jgi:hypothetical protein
MYHIYLSMRVFFSPYHTVMDSDKNKERTIFRHTLRLMQVQYTDYKHTEKLAV